NEPAQLRRELLDRLQIGLHVLEKDLALNAVVARHRGMHDEIAAFDALVKRQIVRRRRPGTTPQDDRERDPLRQTFELSLHSASSMEVCSRTSTQQPIPKRSITSATLAGFQFRAC